MNPNPNLIFLALVTVTAAPLPEPQVVTTDYHGIKVDDPYRYFEDRGNPEVADWARTLSNEALSSPLFNFDFPTIIQSTPLCLSGLS